MQGTRATPEPDTSSIVQQIGKVLQYYTTGIGQMQELEPLVTGPCPGLALFHPVHGPGLSPSGVWLGADSSHALS